MKSTSSGDINYLWDKDNILEELDNSLITQVQYTLVPGFYGPLLSLWSADEGETFLPLFDLQGSTRQLTKQNNVVTDTYLFSSFGEELWITGDTPNPFRYVGIAGYYRNAVNQIQVRARVFKPQQGTWMSPDPIGFDGADWNLYRYVGNDPINDLDPSGLWDQKVHYSMTVEAAKGIYLQAKVAGKICYTTLKYPEAIGEGAYDMDAPWNSAAIPPFFPKSKIRTYLNNWNRHFDFNVDRGDWNRVMKGLPLNNPKDTRIDFFYQQLGKAQRLLKLANGLVQGHKIYRPYEREAANKVACRTSMQNFGRGLHSIEDIYAHMDLTPAEHQDVNNEPFVDNPNWSRGKLLLRQTLQPANNGLMMGGTTAGDYFLGFGNTQVRVFEWKYDKSQHRFNNAKTDIRKRLCSFLKNTVSKSPCAVTECYNSVSTCPRFKPENKCPN